jgi:IPT/TIG domain
MQFLARTTYLSVCLFLTLFTLVACGGGSGGSGGSQTSNPVPSLTSISPTYVPAGNSVGLIVTGSSFVPSSQIEWNSAPLSTTYVSSTTLTAEISGANLQNPEMVSVTVTNPSPGGGTSNAMEFSVGANGQVSSVNVIAVDLAWDPLNQVIYLSTSGANGANWDSVQILDPATGSLGASAFAGSEPYLLSVSATSQYLYVAQGGASTVQALTLPGLGSGFTIDLGSSENFGPLYAMDLQASPNSDSLVAVVRGAQGVSPEEQGGVVIYDNGTALPDALCGFVQSGCTGPSDGLYDSIQWNSSGTEMFAANNESDAFDFYTMQVNSSGFGAVTDYSGDLSCFGCLIHYDATTGYVYDDAGQVVNPSNGAIVGNFHASGIMVPDGTLGEAFFLGQTAATENSATYTIESFDIQTFTPLSSMTITNVPGAVTSFIRWGSNGPAFAANNAEVGAVYLVTGPFVGGAADRSSPPVENVHRTWKARDPVDQLRLTKTDVSSR